MASSFADHISSSLTKLGQTAKTLVKLLLSARSVCFDKTMKNTSLYILGNGPSLRDNLNRDFQLLQQADTLAVNFAANSPEFTSLRPKYYVLADPHFFVNASDANVSKLIASLRNVDWKMTLYVPATAKVPQQLAQSTFLTIKRFNFVAAEGFEWFENWTFAHNLGMPRPRNVLIPSIMIGMWMNYKQIYLLGADHSWSKTLSVDNENHVVTIQPHFYKEEKQELKRINITYQNIPLHAVFESFSIAFRAYHRLQRYAIKKNINIINATPESFIDAFPRGTIQTQK